MATIADVKIVPTPKGVKIPFDSIYLYADGHANLVFPGDVNVPCELEYDVVEQLATLLRRAQGMALKKARNAQP
jgi:hypothetical protein